MVFWYGGSNNSLLTIFYILSLIFLIPFFVVILTTILKVIIVQIPLTVRTFSLLKFIAFSLRSFVYLFIPNPYLVDKIPNFFIPLIFLVILFFLIRLTKNKQTLFLLIWAGMTILVYSITSAPQARYFYLSFVPIIIYIMHSLSFPRRSSTLRLPSFRLEERESRLKLTNWIPSFEGMTNIITIFYLSFIFVSGVIFLQNQKYYWQESSQITKNVIIDLKKYSPQLQKTEVLYFVNLPDSSNNSIWKAYVFRAGFKELLNNFANINPKKIVYFRSFAPTSHTIEAPYIAPEKLKILGNVFVYKEDLKTVVLLSNLQH